MQLPDKFDSAKVSEIAERIEAKISDIAALRSAAETARDALSSAETQLHNLQSELTRSVLSQLDHSLIHRPIAEATSR